MKNILNKKLNLLMLGLVISSVVACADDDAAGLEVQPKPTATTSVSSITLTEGEDTVIPFTISQAIPNVSQFKIEVISGDQADINAGDQDTDADTGIPHVGFEITVPAYATSFDIPVEALIDSECETNENVKLKITAAGVRTILTPSSDGYTVDLSIQNTAVWAFEMTDLYGDGWNGGFLSVDVDGTVTNYAAQNLDDDIGSETQTVYVPIPEGSNYTITYVSGGGTGGSPGWESENVYTITSPDGTTFSDGPTPTEGVVSNGVGISCN